MQHTGHPCGAAVLLVGLVVACSHAPPSRPGVSPEPQAAAGAGAQGQHFVFNPLPCPTLPPAHDTVLDTVYLTLQAPARTTPVPSWYKQGLLTALQSAFEIPASVEFPVFSSPPAHRSEPGADSGTRLVMQPTVSGELEFSVVASGGIANAVLTASSLSPALDGSLLAMVKRADSSGNLPRDPLHQMTATKFYAALTLTRPDSGWWTALFPVRLPQWRNAEAARQRTQSSSAEVAPASQDLQHREESAVMEFVVDEHGRPVPSTLRLIEAHYREFARAAIAKVGESSFRPAAIAGCAVKELRRERFTFPVAE